MHQIHFQNQPSDATKSLVLKHEILDLQLTVLLIKNCSLALNERPISFLASALLILHSVPLWEMT